MRLSNKIVYGLRAMFDLAYHGGAKPVQIREIAEREAIPLRFLEQIFQDLKRAELVKSKRGPKGGFELCREPQAIDLAEIFEALESMPQVPALEAGPCDESEEACSTQVIDETLDALLGAFRAQLSGVTLADLMQRGEAMGVRRQCYDRFVYVI